MLLLLLFWRLLFSLLCAASFINSAEGGAAGNVRVVPEAVRDVRTVWVLLKEMDKISKRDNQDKIRCGAVALTIKNRGAAAAHLFCRRIFDKTAVWFLWAWRRLCQQNDF